MLEQRQINRPEWEQIFNASPAITGKKTYTEDGLPEGKWPWPKDTWFRKQLARVREEEGINGR